MWGRKARVMMGGVGGLDGARRDVIEQEVKWKGQLNCSSASSAALPLSAIFMQEWSGRDYFVILRTSEKNTASQQNQGLLTSTASRSGTPLPLLPRNLQICPITASPLDSKGTISRSKGPTILLKAILGWQALGSRRNHMMRREGGKPLAGGLEKWWGRRSREKLSYVLTQQT